MANVRVRLLLCLSAALLLSACASDPISDVVGTLQRASSDFARGDLESGAWYVNRAPSKYLGPEKVREYFVTNPELISPYLAGALLEARSAAMHERQDRMDNQLEALKILSTVPGVSPERLSAAFDATRAASARIAQMPLERQALPRRLAAAREAARIACIEGQQCDRAFKMAEVFVSQNADMKIQLATQSVIETYNPTEKGKIGLKVLRVPRLSNESELVLTATCRSDGDRYVEEDCDFRLLKVYTDFNATVGPFGNRK